MSDRPEAIIASDLSHGSQGTPVSQEASFEQLQRTNKLLAVLSRAQAEFIANARPTELFEGLLATLLEITESEYGFIGEVHFNDDGSPYLKTHAITDISWSDETRRFYQENAPQGLEFNNLKTLFGTVLTKGTPVIANTPKTDPRSGGLPDGHPALNAFLGIPFYRHEEMVGMVGVANRTEGYNEELVRWLEPFLTTCATLIEAHRNEKRRSQLEAEREQLLLQVSERNKDLQDFAYIISHDLKAPLRAISSLADWIAEDYGDSLKEEGRSQLTLLVSRVKRMNDLMEAVREYSRIGRIGETAKEVCIASLVKEIVTELSPPSNARIETDGSLPTICAEPNNIKLLFLNLIENALIFNDKPQAEVSVSCLSENGVGTFCVSDNGPGIEEKYTEKVFKMFQKLSPRDDDERLGSGLTIAKKIVELCGGEIWLESSLGEGSRVFFTLPLQKEASNNGEVE